MQSTDKHIYKWFQEVHMLEISFWKWKYFRKRIWHLRAKIDLQQPQVAMPKICAAMYLVCHLCQSNPATRHRKSRSGLRTQTADPQSPELSLSTSRLLLGSRTHWTWDVPSWAQSLACILFHLCTWGAPAFSQAVLPFPDSSAALTVCPAESKLYTPSFLTPGFYSLWQWCHTSY